MAGSALAAATDPAAAARYYEDGLARYERKDVAGALIQLRNALKEDGGMLAARVLLARALMEQGDYIAAETAYRDARRMGINLAEIAVPYGQVNLALGRPQVVLETLPKTGLPLAVQAEVLTLHGAAYADMGKTDEGLDAITQAKALDPTAVAPLITEATILLSAGRFAAARTTANRAVEIGPKHAGAWSISASVWHATGNLETALREYSKALELDPALVDTRVARAAILLDLQRDGEAQQDLDALQAKGAKDPRAAYLRSVLASRKGDAKAVSASLMEVQRLVDALPREWLQSREQFLMLGAMSNHALGKRENALTYLEALMKRFPRNQGARKLMASIDLDKGDPAHALTVIEPVLREHPEDASALYLAGRAHIARQNYSKATQLLERAAQINGSNPDVRKSLGQSQVAQGRSELGVASLERAYAAQPGDAGTAFMLATVHMQQGNTKRALGIARGVVDRNPDNLAALNFLGAIQAAANDRKSARETYGKVLQGKPDFLPTQLNLVRLDIAEGRPEDARRSLQALQAKYRDQPTVLYELGVFEKGLGHYPEARDAFTKALQKDRTNLRIAVALIELLLQMNQPAPALEEAKNALMRHPGNFKLLELQARTQLAQGDRKGASQTYQEMTKLADYDAQAQVRTGGLNLQAGNISAAEYNLQKALSTKPDFAPARLLEGEIALARGQFKEAHAIAQSLRAHPDTSAAGARLAAEVALASKDFAKAISLLDDLRKREPSGDNARAGARARVINGDTAGATKLLENWLAGAPGDVSSRLMLAEIHMRNRDWQAARAQYEKLRTAADTKDNPQVVNNLALALLNLNDPAALATAQEALRLAPEDGETLDTVGWVLVLGGKLDEGLRYLRDARLRLPENPEVRWHLGYALAKSGRRQEARAEIDQALRLDPAFVGAEEARRLSQSL